MSGLQVLRAYGLGCRVWAVELSDSTTNLPDWGLAVRALAVDSIPMRRYCDGLLASV